MTDIKGYKPLTDDQKSDMNRFKEVEKTLLNLMKEYITPVPPLDYDLDLRWLNIARTHFEQGFMAACRAIAQPITVEF